MKILASDFDNTLFFSTDTKTTEKNIEAIKSFLLEGNTFCLITGRTYMEIKSELERLELPYTYLICGDGAMIFDSTDYCIERITLEKNVVESVVEYLKDHGYDAYLEDGYNVTENTNDCIKVVAKYTDKEKAIKDVKDINEKFDVYAYASRKHININHKDCNKHIALKRLSELENLLVKEIFVIGDDINDYEMLKIFNGAVITKHNQALDDLNLSEYESLHQYIDYLLEL